MKPANTKTVQRRTIALALASAGSSVILAAAFLYRPEAAPQRDQGAYVQKADDASESGIAPVVASPLVPGKPRASTGVAPAEASVISREASASYETDGKIVPLELIEALGYQTKLVQQSNKPHKQVTLHADGTRGRFYYRRRAQYLGESTELPGTLIVRAEQWDASGHVQPVGAMNYQARPEHFEQRAPSGLLFGTTLEVAANRGMSRVLVATRLEKIKVEVHGHPTRPTGIVDDTPSYEVHLDLLPRLEAIARQALANLVDERLFPGSDTEMGGEPVRTYRCQVTEVEYLDLADWAVARGWAVSEPDAVPSVTLTKDGRTVLLPLAAMQAKVDGTWREMGDCVAEKDGRWLVPATIDGLAH